MKSKSYCVKHSLGEMKHFGLFAGILSTGAVREVVITIIAILVVIILALAVYLRSKYFS